MAKGNMFLGMARGKVGSVVFSRLEGQQVSRAYNSQVANPKSLNQRIQRACFATATRASKFMSSIVDHSFYGTKDGAKCLRRFVQLNSKLLQQAYVNDDVFMLNPRGVNMLVPAPYKVSTGNLTPLTPLALNIQRAGDDFEMHLPLGGFTVEDNLAVASNVLSALNAKVGDQITVVGIIGKIGSDELPTETQFVKARGVFSASAASDATIDVSDISELTPTLFDPNRSDLSNMAFYSSNGQGFFGLVVPTGYSILAGAWILSRYDSNKGDWDYSEQTMLVWEDLGDNVAEAVASYGNAATTATSDYYLDGADSTSVDDTPTADLYPAYAHIALQDAEGNTDATDTVYSTGGNLSAVNLTSDTPRRLLIDVYKVARASFPVVRVYNSNQELVAEDTADSSHVGYSIQINGASSFTVRISNALKQSDGQMGDAVVSEFSITTAVGS